METIASTFALTSWDADCKIAEIRSTISINFEPYPHNKICMQDHDFIAIDCETTGLSCDSDKIIEVGSTRFNLGENGEIFDQLYSPGVQISDFVSRLTGISNDDVAGKPAFAEILPALTAHTQNATIIGHNVQFDIGFIRTHGLDLSAAPRYDTYDLASLVLGRMPSMSLIALGSHFGVLHESAHRALSDAEATRDLFRCIVAEARKLPREAWEQILALKVTQENWLQSFAKLVLDDGQPIPPHFAKEGHSGAASAIDPTSPTDTALTAQLTELLGRNQPSLLETTASVDELAASLPAGDTTLLVAASEAEARQLAETHQVPLVLAPHCYIDPVKRDAFLTRQLSPVEAIFAAKLLLHPTADFFQRNLTRAERLLWDFIAAETLPADLAAASTAPLAITHHASLPAVAELLKPARTVVHSATALSGTLARRESIALDLPALETLLPDCETQLTIWWGLAGQLLRQAEPLYGRATLDDCTGLTAYSSMREAGSNLLSEVSDRLPPALATALDRYLSDEPGFTRTLRTDSGGNLTIALDPQPNPAAISQLASELGSVVFADSALATTPANFNFIIAQLGLPADTPTLEAEAEENKIELLTVPSLPLPNEKSWQAETEHQLMQLINTLPGITVVLFNGRYAQGQFFEKTHASATRPVFAERASGSQGKIMLELSQQQQAAYLATSAWQMPPRAQNLIIVKIPFVVRDGADWSTETLPTAVLTWKKAWRAFTSCANRPATQQVICLDNRLTGKGYGKHFSAAVGARPTSL